MIQQLVNAGRLVQQTSVPETRLTWQGCLMDTTRRLKEFILRRDNAQRRLDDARPPWNGPHQDGIWHAFDRPVNSNYLVPGRPPGWAG